MTVRSSIDSAPPTAAGSDVETIALVGVAHGTSHFFHLLLPPLFPMLAAQYGFSYAELGLLVTVFFVLSGVGQALAGFVVDRVGSWPVLMLAMGAFVAAAGAAAAADSYAGFMLAAGLAGIGNAPFHPADFTILNQRVSQSRLGHAFSVHGVSGNLGWAAAPVVIVSVSTVAGTWRAGMIVCAAWAAAIGLLLWWRRAALKTRAANGPGPVVAKASSDPSTFAFLRLPSVWVCFLFFFWSTCALTAVQSFIGPAINRLYDTQAEWIAMVVTAYMVFSAVGMLIGGFWVKRAGSLERTIAMAMGAAAVLLLVAGSGWLPAAVCGALVAVSGMGTGLAGPSRDMLIRQAAPAGATGRVYGTVYSGLDVGFAVAAPIFGAMLDRGGSSSVFLGAALALVLGLLSAGWVARRVAAEVVAKSSLQGVRA